MLRTRDQIGSGDGGPTATAAALTHALIVADETVRPSLRLRAQAKLHAFERHCVHDLAEAIGSRQWYRGLGTMAGLTIAALAFWPDLSALEAAPAVRPQAAERDELRSQMLMPLASGGESGRRVGANPALVVPLAAAPQRSAVHMVATSAEGDTFTRMLQRAGVSPYDAARAAELVGAVTPLAEVRPGTRFDITLGRADAGAARPLDKLEFRARFDTALTLSRAGADLTIGRHAIAVDTTPLRIRGTVGGGLYRSARAAGAPIEAVQQYLQAVDQHLGLDNVAPGDAFDIVIAAKRSAAGELETGKLMFAGIEHEGKPRLQLMRWGDKGELFDAANMGSGSAVMVQPMSGGMMMPVIGHITSGYGMRRHPILGYARLHAGVDFGAAWGSPIVAVAAGIVSYAGRHGGHGNYVRLEHGGGLGTGYGHMSRIAVAPGTKVAAGQVIGYVGSTGLSTGPHLHYEVYEGGRTVNPLGVSFAMARTKAAPIETKQFAEFKKRLDAIKGIKPFATQKSAALGKASPRVAFAD